MIQHILANETYTGVWVAGGYTYQGRTRREKNQYYYCNGRMQQGHLCDMPNFRADLGDNAVWTWVMDLILHPNKLAEGLRAEQAELSAHLQDVTVTDEQIAEIELFCAQVREGLDSATFEDKRRYFDLLDVRGTLAVEDGEKVVYIKCRIGEQRRSVALISQSSSTGVTATMFCACPPTRRFR